MNVKFVRPDEITFSRSAAKIIPPAHAPTPARPRVGRILKQALDYRLTTLQAEAGYGKSASFITGAIYIATEGPPA
jgi:ATP/maltotriose-dependent transcriptional regulator MalT